MTFKEELYEYTGKQCHKVVQGGKLYSVFSTADLDARKQYLMVVFMGKVYNSNYR